MGEVEVKRNIFEKRTVFLRCLMLITKFVCIESLNDRYFSFPNSNVSSICPYNGLTQWNTKNVSQILMEWIKSVTIEWSVDEQVPCENDCKMFVRKPNTFVDQYAPNDLYGDTMMIGKVEDRRKLKIRHEKMKKTLKLMNRQTFLGQFGRICTMATIGLLIIISKTESCLDELSQKRCS